MAQTKGVWFSQTAPEQFLFQLNESLVNLGGGLALLFGNLFRKRDGKTKTIRQTPKSRLFNQPLFANLTHRSILEQQPRKGFSYPRFQVFLSQSYEKHLSGVSPTRRRYVCISRVAQCRKLACQPLSIRRGTRL